MIIIDPQLAGVSGDMLLSALVDMGVSEKIIIEVAEKIKKNLKGCKKISINFVKTKKKGFKSTYLKLKIEEDIKNRKIEDFIQVINKVSKGKVRDFSLNVINSLTEAEKNIHGHADHFHELRSADTLIDILGTAEALNSINAFDEEIICLPVAVGGGTIKAHGSMIPIPAPATLYIAEKFKVPIVGGPVKEELTTPTGIAILVNLCEFREFIPFSNPVKEGYGAGTKDLEIPNILRIFQCNEEVKKNEIYIVRTNLDDVNPENLGYLMDILSKEVNDICFIPILMKKNRHGVMVEIQVKKDKLKEVIKKLVKETGTLGVRVERTDRYCSKRSIKEIEINIERKKEKVRIKISEFNDIKNMKCEYEDIKRVAEKYDLSLNEVRNKVKKAYEKDI